MKNDRGGAESRGANADSWKARLSVSRHGFWDNGSDGDERGRVVLIGRRDRHDRSPPVHRHKVFIASDEGLRFIARKMQARLDLRSGVYRDPMDIEKHCT